MKDEALKVGELARRTGVSIRTLHHYDEIGLLSPGIRTGAGHRLYRRAELRRLQQILSLRQLGFSLEEIRECLDRGDAPSLLETIERHLEQLDRQLEIQRKLQERLQGLARKLRSDDAESVGTEEWIRTIEETVMFEKYYTKEQLEQLEQRRAEVGEDRIAQVQVEWTEVFAGFEELHQRGADPACDEALELARRAQGLIDEFTGGNAGITPSLGRLYEGEGGRPKVLAKYGMNVSPEASAFMSRAMEALRSAS